jgi:hypothetical protein
MWIFRKIPSMGAEVHLREYFDFHVYSLWSPPQKLTSFAMNQCGAPRVSLNICIMNNGKIYNLYSVVSLKTNRIHCAASSWLFQSHTHSSHVPSVYLYNFPLSALLIKHSITIPFPTQCRYRHSWRLTLTSIKLIIFYSLRLEYQIGTVRDIPRIETEILSKMYFAVQVQCR